MRSPVLIVVLCIVSSDAIAGEPRDADLDNVMVGPLFGIRLGGPPGAVPLIYPGYGCNPDETRGIASLAVGYRYTGIHELYVTVKAGVSEPLCF
jgi:hypothetical protein